MQDNQRLRNALLFALNARDYTYLRGMLPHEQAEQVKPEAKVPDNRTFFDYILCYEPMTLFTRQNLRNVLTNIIHVNPFVGRDLRELTSVTFSNFYTTPVNMKNTCAALAEGLTLHHSRTSEYSENSVPIVRLEEMFTISELESILLTDKILFVIAGLVLMLTDRELE